METVTKPDRYPDYVASYGSAFWWPEMVYMGAMGGIYRIGMDEDLGRFYVISPDGEKGKFLNEEIKRFYDVWWYETFESKFLGESTDEDTAPKS